MLMLAQVPEVRLVLLLLLWEEVVAVALWRLM